MKTKLLSVLLLIGLPLLTLKAQVNPTLGIGLETLTLNKGTIDVEVLTKVILKKQKELKNEALKRFMLKMFPDTNYTTRFYVQNCLNILLNEKNPQVIEKEILELTTNYAIALGVTKAVIEMDNSIFTSKNPKLNKQIDYQKLLKDLKYDTIISNLDSKIDAINYDNKSLESLYEHIDKINIKLKLINKELSKPVNKVDLKSIKNNYDIVVKYINNLVFDNNHFSEKFKEKHNSYIIKDDIDENNRDIIKTKFEKSIKKIDCNYRKYIKKRIKKVVCGAKKIKKSKRKLMRNNFEFDFNNKANENNNISNELNFGEKLDVVSLALSENDLLRKKGFFKNKIDYRADQGYFFDAENDNNIVKNIDVKIKPYIENYDIIKNFIENNNISDPKNIVESLNTIYLNQIDLESSFFTSNEGKTSNAIYKSEIQTLRNVLKFKNDLDNLQALQEVNTTQIKNIDIKQFVPIATIKDITTLKEFPIDNLKTLSIAFNDLIKLINYNTSLGKIIEDIKINPDIKDDVVRAFTGEKMAFSSISLISQNDVNANFNALNQLVDEIITLKSDVSNQIDTASIPDNDPEKLKFFNDKIDEFNKKINSINTNIISIANNKSLNQNTKTIGATILNVNDLKIKTYLEINKEQIKNIQQKISKLPEFFTIFINDLLNKIENQNLKRPTGTTNDITANKKLSSLITNIYERLNYFKNNKNYTITDINYLENELLPQLVGIRFSDVKENKTSYDTIFKGIKNLTPLLKINILLNKKLNDLNIKYDEKLISLLEFIGNLDKLDKAQTYASIIDLITENSKEITKILPDGAFKDSYNLFINGVNKYTLINPTAKKQYVEIDVVSFLNDMQQHYQRNNPSIFSLYLSIGLNQNMFINEFKFSNSDETLNSIGFASEKIGVKYKLLDFKKYRGYENAIKSDIYLNKRAPFINEWYAAVYGSGLLYSLANTSTNQNFNFPHVGIATGFRFYNALDFNIMLGLPFVKDQKFGNNGFVGIGFDIPLGEYLEALGNK